ncbi:MAG: hypothetical protein Q4B75_01410 [Eubacteriales bacterium]|nr:hypothetical protein [Eubacteriales bacterium]
MKREKKIIDRKLAWTMLVVSPVMIALVTYVVLSFVTSLFFAKTDQMAFLVESAAGLVGIVSYLIIAYVEMKCAY